MPKSIIHRITDYSLINIADSEKINVFYGIKEELALEAYHYLQADSPFFSNIVWADGTFKHRLNKTYISENLFTPDVDTTLKDYLRYNDISFRLKQGFNWDGIFGLHLIIKTSNSNQILLSQMCLPSEFKIAETNLLLEGDYWLEEIKFQIPHNDEILLCQVTEITFNDIVSEGNDELDSDLGFIYNFPTEYLPLIDEKPMPDYIKTRVSFDDNQFLLIQLSTTENKTIERSILDYFGLTLANIDISHIVYYGNETVGFESLRVSNDINKFLPVNIGLNLSRFLVDVSLDIEIFVTTEIKIDNKLMKREAHITTNLEQLNTLIESKITHPETNFPVEVINETVINNTVIDAKETVKIATIYQPVFVEFISGDLVIEPKHITFDKITKPVYLRINNEDVTKEQIIISKQTVDGQIYFDLSELQPVSKETTYNIIDNNSKVIIGKGRVLEK